MKKQLFVVSIEPIEQRYTCQWYTDLPAYLKQQLVDFNVVPVNGITNSTTVTPGAFLDFAGTNCWKNEQANYLLNLIRTGMVNKGDHVLFADAWNPTITEIKYTSDLLGLNLTLHGLWHAGSYDPQDFLGRLIGDVPWVRNLEASMFYALDHNYFATEFHAQMFSENLFDCDWKTLDPTRITITGWPMDYLPAVLVPSLLLNAKANYHRHKKKDLIVFPHRIAPEKQIEIFRDLAISLPQYEWIVAQDAKLSKIEYHKLLADAKIVFSANLQETLGISTCAEGPIMQAVPLAPNRLSYSEIFASHPEFLYPSEWTKDFQSYQAHKPLLVDKIIHTMRFYYDLLPYVFDYNKNTLPKYFSGINLITSIKGSK